MPSKYLGRVRYNYIVVPSKMAASGHFVKKKKKVAYRSEMARNAIESEFWTSKMAGGSHFVHKFPKNKKLWY